MSTPHEHPDKDRELEEIQRPMDDPQTRPALDPEDDPPEDD